LPFPQRAYLCAPLKSYLNCLLKYSTHG
jgi:hypothetical protein